MEKHLDTMIAGLTSAPRQLGHDGQANTFALQASRALECGAVAEVLARCHGQLDWFYNFAQGRKLTAQDTATLRGALDAYNAGRAAVAAAI